ncbi:hypothetical protein EVAR_87075_1 [Eumeta japonica]|uniref:Uncharacterized protein n=1 Tax=Eumeta variegata TaxID=151549 RepID=A0A4C1VQ79_EUMVA|nr:hypothetical protein EVAR_87075_1 [Eumeta japonica]
MRYGLTRSRSRGRRSRAYRALRNIIQNDNNTYRSVNGPAGGGRLAARLIRNLRQVTPDNTSAESCNYIDGLSDNMKNFPPRPNSTTALKARSAACTSGGRGFVSRVKRQELLFLEFRTSERKRNPCSITS